MKKLLVCTLLCFLYTTSAISSTMDEAETALRNGDYAEAYCMMKPLAKAGNNEAQYNIGWMYHNGYGLRVNDNLALEWWLSASEQGNTDASFSIAMLYNLGEGQISKNLVKAVDYYLLAAADHHDEAIIILRSMLRRDDQAIQTRKRELINHYGSLFGPRLQVKASTLNFRTEPTLDSTMMIRLERGHPVIELHRQGKWSQVGIINSPSEQQTIAWVYNRYLAPPEKIEMKKTGTEIPVNRSDTQLNHTDDNRSNQPLSPVPHNQNSKKHE